MASSLSDEICLYLQTKGLGLNFNGAGTINLFSTLLLDQPDLAAAVIDRPGSRPLMVMTGGTPVAVAESRLDQPFFQVRVRSGMTGYTAGNAMVEGIFKALQGVTETVLNVGGSLFHLITANQSPAYLGRDEKERHQWSQNFRVIWSNAQR